jgi:tripartite-type tricarboxylate transporter receptor subunit TctC
MKFLCRQIALIAALLIGAASAQGQAYPTQPIRIVIGFPPGGAIDTIARVIAPKMAAELGQAVVVDNRAGAGGVVGMQSVARATPDGYTVFMGTMGNFSITPALVKDLPYDVAKDFAPVTQVATAGFVLFANPRLPAKNVAELVAYAKANPQLVNYSSSGIGGLPHMAGEMFNAAAGTKMVHVAYKGSAPSVNDVVGGQVQLTFEAVTIGMPQVQAGRLKPLATTGMRRLEILPDVPTVAETLPGFEVRNWFGVAAPAATPADRVERLQRSIALALRQPDVAATLAGLGVEAVGDTPAQFNAYIRTETARWQQLITKNGIKAE